jgi:hypothetical protein
MQHPNPTSLLPRYEHSELAGQLMDVCWPGGHPFYYLDSDNSVLCPGCARKQEQEEDPIERFLPVDYGINYEDPDLYCDECSARIGSAYAEEDTD